MAQTQSSLRGRSTPNAGNQPCGTAYASAATREGESLMLLETALVMDPNSRIKSNDPLCSLIDKVADIAKMTNVDKYTVDLQRES
jgi:hypothetical protein